MVKMNIALFKNFTYAGSKVPKFDFFLIKFIKVFYIFKVIITLMYCQFLVQGRFSSKFFYINYVE